DIHDSILSAAPPAGENGVGRINILEEVDKHITGNHLADEIDFINFYSKRMDRALASLEKPRPRSGTVRVTKLYSSGVVVTSKEGSLGIDLVDGPVKNDRPPEDLAGTPFSGFTLSETQRERLAQSLDILFITHFHHDHAGFGIARAMIRAGKKVILPGQCRTYWLESGAEWAKDCQVVKPDIIHLFNGGQFRFWPGTQYMAWSDGNKEVPQWNHPENAENLVFLIKMENLVFLHSGDNRDMNILPWMERVAREGWDPNLVFSPGLECVGAPLQGRLSGFRLPVHDYEFLHPRFNRIPTRWKTGAQDRMRRGRDMDLFWGESVLFSSNGFSHDV
ncbi:MAG: MBL fold metallo-hydrolase, partial [Spirochaetia bacterium]|nr:MBL fold metallo-hydrolase [Spirochaetia bacterium]